MSETYSKINSIYKRYQFDGKICPKKEWLKFKNKIILGNFSDDNFRYLFDNAWEAYSKIDGTCSKIYFYPSTGIIKVGGKSDNATSQHGQFEMLQEIADRIHPMLRAMFPKETARFTQVKDKETNKIEYWDMADPLGITKINPSKDGQYIVGLEEVPVYIYGEYFGTGVQKGGGRYIQNGNGFLVFDIRQQGWWLPKDMRDEMCKALKLETVPYIGNMTLRDIEQMVMKGFKTKFDRAADPTLIEEGIVARPVIPMCDGRGNRIIVKVKYVDYIEYQRVREEFTDEEFEEFNTWYKETIGL